MKIIGVDFTSAPTRRKPITAALGKFDRDVLKIDELLHLESFDAFDELIRRAGPWVGAFDFPFGLPREAIEDLNWPRKWHELVIHCRGLNKFEFKRQLDCYRKSRETGSRYATRRGDKASGAHPAVKLVNPPVGKMFYEGAPRLAAAGLKIPSITDGDPARIALEAYPGLLIKRQLAIRDPYKNDQRSKQTPAHRKIRNRIVSAIKNGKPHGIRLRIGRGIEQQMIEDGAGDNLDAVICAIQASWGQQQGAPGYGLPPNVDPLEGWIVSA